jgi:hypothetical protein
METKSDKIIVPVNATRVGPWDAIVYQEADQRYLDELISTNQAILEQEAEIHPEDCPWWHDWHRCSCGAFDIKE